ncbi:DUF2877 domain-containing protein [Proteiniborus sp.]|uniref:DUF2877 domain-containing protein n=1 Tax=Proteiniborus sp. TaxID=2079015 RepID=UPI00332B12B1
MIASNICKDLYESLQRNRLKGQIHSVFDNSFNVIDQDNHLISFLGPNKPMAPRSIKLTEKISFIDLGFEQGQKLEFYDDFVFLKENNIIISFDKALLWNKEPLLFSDIDLAKDSMENVFRKLCLMGTFILEEGKKEGIVPLLKTLEGKIKGIEPILDNNILLSKREEFIRERFLAFIDSYLKENIEEIPLRSKDIIGFGIGLTPSMDDFLSGMMVSRIYLSSYLNHDFKKAIEINKAIVKNIKNKTTLVSEEMLKYSSMGEVNEDVRNLMATFLSNSSTNTFYKYLKKVADFGETSGTDMISGIYIGSQILLN